jgi:outer membrane murein-binding lipoprotein Lpp
MKKISFIFLSVLLISGCSNSCDSAKANVAKYLNQYMNAIYQGQSGASVPGGVEALQALEVAKKDCNRPYLKVEEILNPEIAKLKAQSQQQLSQPVSPQASSESNRCNANVDSVPMQPSREGLVIGSGRLQFYQSPAQGCEIKGVFVVPGDYLTVFSATPDNGWAEVTYTNPKTGNDFSGWVQKNRLQEKSRNERILN